MILRMSGMKPMSSIRSASSRTRIDLAEVRRPLPDVVEEPARRGDEELDAGPEFLELRSIGTPP